MAQRVHVVLVDDIDGGDASETVSFGLDGVDYEIDLSERHANELRESLALYVGHGRRTGGRKRAYVGYRGPIRQWWSPVRARRARRPRTSESGHARTGGTCRPVAGSPPRSARRTPPLTETPAAPIRSPPVAIAPLAPRGRVR